MESELEKLSNYTLDIDDENLSILSQNTEICLFEDEFENKKTIQFTNAGYGIIEASTIKENDPYFKLYNPNKDSSYYFFGITFINHNGFSYMEVALRGDEIRLASGDYFIILFEDGTKEKFTFQVAAKGNKYFSYNNIPLTSKDLFNFLTKKIDKTKVVSVRKNVYSIYCLNEQENNSNNCFKYKYTSRKTGQYLLNYMTYKFIDFNLQTKI